MGLTELQAIDAARLAKTANGGESVTYKPKAGGDHSFNALVYRAEPDSEPGSSRSRKRSATVWIPYSSDPTVGRTAAAEQKDKINLVMERGQPAVDAVVARVGVNATGFLVVQVLA